MNSFHICIKYTWMQCGTDTALMYFKWLSFCTLRHSARFTQLKDVNTNTQEHTPTDTHAYDAKEMVDLYHTFWIRPWPCCLPPQNILPDQRDGKRTRSKQDGEDDVIYNSKEKHKIWQNTINSSSSNCWRTYCPCIATLHFSMHLLIIHKKTLYI